MIDFERLKSLKPGEIVDKYDFNTNRDYVVLENNYGTIYNNMILITKCSFGNISFLDFDERADPIWANDFSKSRLRRYINDPENVIDIKRIYEDFGNHIIEHESDLLSLDGFDTYGKCKSLISCMSLDDYRKYRRYIYDKAGSSYWLTTPRTTNESDDFNYYVLVVGYNGDVFDVEPDDKFGVRPLIEIKF